MEKIMEMARTAYHALADKKGEDIKVIDISGICVLTDYFIIANGSSDNQVQALVNSVEEKMGQNGFHLKQREGQGSWVLLDYEDVIVHIFDRESREFYNLERIWSDGKIVDVG